ncbi:Ig-like domain-containing protein [Desulfofundulus thermosubterraneus]|uniref:Ig-like domain (Group 3) n=1 Tax=Desulfofundulus thermosubterraneus DSM 16057 TaxID=1121432 RepID=A0A1M6GTY3_9FIRM|nr:Ig-like domain-containing protein [Desulfofundulus thermosubterraneus]SHJ13401.1 Ig-like domain (group 3) [Desulfofundulus thermosubterraneus DSM 16057]
MPRVKHLRVITLAMALVFLFTSVAFAAGVPQYIYFGSGSDMVKVDYAQARKDAMQGNKALYNGVVQHVGNAIETGAAVVVETDDQKVLDYQKGFSAGKRFADIVNDPAYQTEKPAVNKELRLNENGQPEIGDIQQPAVVEISSITPTDTLGVVEIVAEGTTAEALQAAINPRSTVVAKEGIPNTYTVTIQNAAYDQEITLEFGAGFQLKAGVNNRVKWASPKLEVVSVSAINAINVEYGTPVDSLELPAQVEVTLSDNSTQMIDVNWDTSSYDGNTAGTYTFEGTLVLPENLTNPNGLKASVDVIVAEAPDTEVPVITLDQTDATVNKAEFTVSGRVSEAATVKVNGEEVTVNEDLTFSTVVTLTEGANIITVEATDAAGNAATPVSINVTLDTTAPAITVEGVSNNAFYNAGVTPVVTTDDENATVTMTLDGAEYDGSEIAAEGAHELVVTATDAVGNEATKTVRFTIDLTAPVITVAAATVDVTADQQKLTFTVEDANVSAEDITVAQAGQTLAVTAEEAANTYSVLLNEVQGANQTLTIDVTDKAGNAAEQVSVTLVDKKAPEIVSVENVNGNQLVVVFSEAVDENNAETISNYVLRNVTTGEQLTLGNSGNADYAVLQADGKTVLITLSTATTNTLGVENMGTLDAVQYRLFVNPVTSVVATRVKDVVGNYVAVNSYKDFTGGIGADTQAPVLASASLDLDAGTNGRLILTANETVQAVDAYVDQSKISIGGISLATATVSSSVYSESIVLELTAELKSQVAALEDLTVTVQAGAFKDLAGNDNAAGSVVATSAVYVRLLSATYDELANQLTLVFDRAIDVSAFANFADVTLKGATNKTLADLGAVLKTTTDSDTLVFEATDDRAIGEFEGTGDAPASPAIDIASGVFAGIDGKYNARVTDGALTYVNDDVKPYIVSASYDEATNLLHLVFNEKVNMNVSNFNGSGDVQFFADGNDQTPVVDLSGLQDDDLYKDAFKSSKFTANEYGSEVWIDIAANTTVADDKVEAISDKNSLKLRLGNAGVLVDTNGNSNDADTAETQVAVSYTSSATSALAGALVASKSGTPLKLLKATFDSNMNAASVENTANWQLYLKANPANQVAITKVDLLADGRTAYLWTATALTAGAKYVLKATGIQDTFGNSFTESADITASGADANPVTLESGDIRIKDVDGSGTLTAADTITLVFSEPVEFNLAGLNQADFAKAVGTSVDYLPNATFAAGVNSNELIITLGSGADPVDKKFGIANNADFTAASGQTVKFAADDGDLRTILPPAGVVRPTLQSVKYADSNNSGAIDEGDQLVLAFDVDVVASDGDFNENSVDVSDNNGATTESIDLQDGAVVSGKTVTVRLAVYGIEVDSGIPAVNLNDVATLKVTLTNADLANKWGQAANDANDIAITSDDTTGPALVAARFVANALDLNGDGYTTGHNETNPYGYVVLTFDEGVNVDSVSANVYNDFEFDISGNSFGSNPEILRFTDNAADGTKIVIKLGADSVIDVGLVKINVKSQPADMKNIWDAAGNAYRKTSTTGVTITQ